MIGYPHPKYQETIDLSQLNYKTENVADSLNKAIDEICWHMKKDTFLPSISGSDGSLMKYVGITKENSIIFLSGFKKKDIWQTGLLTVINMRKRDDGLVRKLKKIAVESAKK